jgi:very-short-patch-repair endonuclease
MNIPFEKSFASYEKSKEWIDRKITWSDKNKNTLKSHEIYKSSHTKYWFNCQNCEHEFECSISNIQKRNCPYCCKPPKKLCDDDACKRCFEKSFASHEKSICWSVNKNVDNSGNHIAPRQIFKSSGKKFWFKCNNCPHEFESSLDALTGKKPSWCPYCCIPSKKLCDDSNCIFCFEKSFASHEKSNCWSDKNIDNSGTEIKPRQVLKFSNNSYIFDCNLCNHENKIALNNANAGNWCSYCCNPPQKLCDYDECKKCFEKSFASHIKSKYWIKNNIDNYKNPITPRQIFKRSDTLMYKFYCNICNHEFDRLPLNIQDIDSMTHCIYCVVPTKIICNDDKCLFCHERSFASHPKSECWSKRNIDNSGNEINPRQVIKGNNNHFIFNCDTCRREFSSPLSHVVGGTWCPYCINKTEKKMYEILSTIYPNLIQQYKVEWCKNSETNRYLPFDFCIEEYKIIFELDGAHHFEQVSNWKSPEENHKRDVYKEKCANDNGYSIIRILQEYVADDKNNWLVELQNAIQTIQDEPDVLHNIYISNDNYDYNTFL